MRLAKIFITLTFLLAFALQVPAQGETPKIVWKNLQEKYERFEDIKPIIINESDQRIFYYSDSNTFEYFDREKNEWQPNYPWGSCLSTKESKFKLNSKSQIELFKSWVDWYSLTCCDIVFNDYRAKHTKSGIKYRLEIFYTGGNSKNRKSFYSPEFEVIEKDFKK